MRLNTRELLLNTYDLECLGPFSLKEERFVQTIKAFPLLKLLPEGNPHATWDMLGPELDLLQAIYLSKVLYQLFEIRAVPIPTRY